jgi:hypothetical protein
MRAQDVTFDSQGRGTLPRRCETNAVENQIATPHWQASGTLQHRPCRPAGGLIALYYGSELASHSSNWLMHVFENGLRLIATSNRPDRSLISVRTNGLNRSHELAYPILFSEVPIVSFEMHRLLFNNDL